MASTLRRLLSPIWLFVALGTLVALPFRDEVTLQTSQECYALGDTVRFTLANVGDSTIYMPSDPPWRIWDASGDTVVAPGIVLWVITTLAGSDSTNYAWDQRNHGGVSVGTGTYYVTIDYSPQLEPWTPFTIADTFLIGGPTPEQRLGWGAIKALWR